MDISDNKKFNKGYIVIIILILIYVFSCVDAFLAIRYDFSGFNMSLYINVSAGLFLSGLLFAVYKFDHQNIGRWEKEILYTGTILGLILPAISFTLFFLLRSSFIH
mgnify:FL=1